MFNLDKKYISENVETGGTTINKSGCYDVVISEAKIWKSENSKSESLNIKFNDLTTNKKAWLSLFYKGRNGQDIEFNTRHITHLAYLLNVNPEADNGGNINAFKDKTIGVFLVVKAVDLDNGGQGYEFSLQGFYDPRTRLTAKEKSENLPAEIYNKFVERFKDAEEIELNSNSNKNTSDEGFFPVNNDDIPF